MYNYFVLIFRPRIYAERTNHFRIKTLVYFYPRLLLQLFVFLTIQIVSLLYVNTQCRLRQSAIYLIFFYQVPTYLPTYISAVQCGNSGKCSGSIKLH